MSNKTATSERTEQAPTAPVTGAAKPLDIKELHDKFHAFVKMKPGPERQRAILDWLDGSNEQGAANKIPVNGRMQLSVRDPDLASLLKRGILVAQHYGGKGSKYAKFGTKGQTFLALA